MIHLKNVEGKELLVLRVVPVSRPKGSEIIYVCVNEENELCEYSLSDLYLMGVKFQGVNGEQHEV